MIRNIYFQKYFTILQECIFETLQLLKISSVSFNEDKTYGNIL